MHTMHIKDVNGEFIDECNNDVDESIGTAKLNLNINYNGNGNGIVDDCNLVNIVDDIDIDKFAVKHLNIVSDTDGVFRWFDAINNNFVNNFVFIFIAFNKVN